MFQFSNKLSRVAWIIVRRLISQNNFLPKEKAKKKNNNNEKGKANRYDRTRDHN